MPSSVVSHINYDPVSLILRITFVSGMVYEYLDVPQQVYDDMKSSGSKGIFLNRHIKPHYKYRKVN